MRILTALSLLLAFAASPQQSFADCTFFYCDSGGNPILAVDISTTGATAGNVLGGLAFFGASTYTIAAGGTVSIVNAGSLQSSGVTDTTGGAISFALDIVGSSATTLAAYKTEIGTTGVAVSGNVQRPAFGDIAFADKGFAAPTGGGGGGGGGGGTGGAGVPEPSTLLGIFAFSLVGVGFRRRRPEVE